MRFLVNSTKLLLIASAVSLAACGGGGDGSDGSIIGLPTDGAGNGTDGGGTGNGTDGSVQVTLGLGTGNGDTFQSGALALSSSTLSAGGQATVSANIVNQTADNALYTTSSTVTFTSTCVEQGTASITSPVTTSTGTAQSVYTANGCSGSDTITASLSGGSATASANIIVASPEAGSLAFSSATPATIALKNLGSAGLATVSEVQFIVKNNTGNPLQNENVTFTLSDTTGGVSLTNSSDKTDSNGIARAFVNSGTVKTTVRVTATLDSNPTLKTTSSTIAIGTGIPSQNSMSLSRTVANPRALNYDGTEVEFTLRVSDFYNNPIPEGTKIVFFTSGGQIDPECTYSAEDGGCSVTWRGQEPRPADGIAVVMASLKGEESTGTDKNANGLFDADRNDADPSNDEIYTALSEAYLDANHDGNFDADELYIDWNGNGIFDTLPSTKFRGVRCTEYAQDVLGHCSNLADLFLNATIVMSGEASEETIYVQDVATSTFLDPDVDTLDENSRYRIIIADAEGNSVPNGTQIAITIASGDDTLKGGAVSYTVPDNAMAPYSRTIEFEPEIGGSVLKIEVTNVGGSKPAVLFDIN